MAIISIMFSWQREFHYDLEYADLKKNFCLKLQIVQISPLLFGRVNYIQKKVP